MQMRYFHAGCIMQIIFQYKDNGIKSQYPARAKFLYMQYENLAK